MTQYKLPILASGLSPSLLLMTDVDKKIISLDYDSSVLGIDSSGLYVKPEGLNHGLLLNVHQDVNTDASPTFAGIVIPDGGTIGQAAGPLLTFDDTLNYLEITGCYVGIGTITPAYILDVFSANSDVARFKGTGAWSNMLIHSPNGLAVFQYNVNNTDRAGSIYSSTIPLAGATIFDQGATVGALVFANATAQPIAFITNGSEAMRIQSGDLTLVNNLIMGDGKTIGQAAGPLLTFDDTNNYLEITGCDVGIGTATPTYINEGRELAIMAAGVGAANFDLGNLGTIGDAIGVAGINFLAVGQDTHKRLALISCSTDGATSGQRGGKIYFYTKPDASTSITERMSISSTGAVIMSGTLTVNGDQTGATDHVFDDYDDIELLHKWRDGKTLPFGTGDMLNRDRLLRDTILQLEKRIKILEL